MAQTATTSVSATGDVLDYIALLKPRVMSLVVFTGFAGLAVAPGEMHPILAAVAVFCIALASGAAGAINMWYDRDIDALMERTRERPLPTGKIEPAEALSFGVILAAGAIMLMFLATNAMAAGGPACCGAASALEGVPSARCRAEAARAAALLEAGRIGRRLCGFSRT